MASTNQAIEPRPRVTICVGDLHGYIERVEKLWSNLKATIPKQEFDTALVIFLGDYCDRGPNAKEVYDFLIELPSKYPKQRHVFLAGNHDLAFSAFLGILPEPENGVSFKDGWGEYEQSEDREGWYKGDGYESMYLQGRRWGGHIKVRFNVAKGTEYQGSIYDARPTFESYGVPHGSAELRKAVPEAHKKFLSNLVWIHEEEDVCIETDEGLKHCNLIAVHAGLETAKDVQEQMVSLKEMNLQVPLIKALSGRKSVWDMPKKLTEKATIVVSGHHGKLHIDGLRLIIDESGGLPDYPIAAIVLPSKRIVRDTDKFAE